MSHARSALQNYPEYEVVIGIEVHVQLNTHTKIFCSCINQACQEPNSNICQICTGMPGTLPVLNERVIQNAIAVGLSTHSTIAPKSSFDRKHYFYPDLPKGYQITQQYEPICIGGHVPIRLEDGRVKNIHLTRIHIEEDAGKNIHSATSNESFVDLNRAGTPLLEIVSEPEISSAYEARAYLKALRANVMSLGVGSGNMEEGAFRADTNISIRKKGATTLGTKCELKNINSFKFIGDAIEYEIERQIGLLEEGQKVKQETRLWDTKAQRSVVMRTKEEAADYRYFREPDLPTILVDEAMIAAVKTTLPELPFDKATRYVSSGLTQAEADILIDNMELAAYFDEARKHTTSKQLINWILRDLQGYLKETKTALTHSKLTPKHLAHIVTLVAEGTLNNNSAKEVFTAVMETGAEPAAIIKEKGFDQSIPVDQLRTIVQDVLAQHAKEVELYKTTGNERMIGLFVGKAMQKTAGKGNPKVINDLIKELLG